MESEPGGSAGDACVGGTSYLSGEAVRRRRLAALLHGRRRRRRRREALSADGGHLKERQGGVEVHGDLRGDGVWRRRLQADRQRSSWTLDRVVMVENIELGGEDVHHWRRSVARHGRGRSLAAGGIWKQKQ